MRASLILLLFPFCVTAQDFRYRQNIEQDISITITREKNHSQSIDKDRFGNKICKVEFDAEVDSVWHKAQGSHIWDGGQLNSDGCSAAAVNARQNLTRSLRPVTLTSKQTFTFQENSNTKKISNYKKKDIVDISNLRLNPNFANKTIAHEGVPCKWFFDAKLGERGIEQYNIIACKLSIGWVAEEVF